MKRLGFSFRGSLLYRFRLAQLIGFSSFLLLVVPYAGAAETITLATTDWPPHYSPSLESDGYFSEISREAFKRGGYELNIEFVPWKRAIEGGKKGDYDGVMGLVYSSERAHKMEFTKPIRAVNLVLIKRADSNIPDNYSSYQELTSYTVGVPRGYILPKEFEQAGFKFEFADGDELNLRKILKRRVDLIIDYGEVVYYFLNTKYPENRGELKTLSPPLEVSPLYVTISKQRTRSKEIVAAFNQGLESMQADGTYEAILLKHGVLQAE